MINALTVPEVAAMLRCSRAHVHHLIKGKSHRSTPLPSVQMGRRRIVLVKSLEDWIRANEHGTVGDTISERRQTQTP